MIDMGGSYECTEIMHDRTTDDLISRQAAIDILCRALHYNYEEGYAVTQMYSLPSAQPDGIPLEWIDKHLEWLDNCDNEFAQLAKVGIRAMVEIWKKDKT